jgi:hypothetical protein
MLGQPAISLQGFQGNSRAVDLLTVTEEERPPRKGEAGLAIAPGWPGMTNSLTMRAPYRILGA